jgi:hypothetical protein
MTRSQKEDRLCPICNRPGQRRVVELQPTDGELWKVDHDDGTTCEWDQHRSIESLYKKRPQNTDYMVCPICSKNGKIITFRKDKIYKPYKYDYKISHGKKFCEITKQEDRDTILKFLGRWVGEDQHLQPKESKQSKRRRIICTVCLKPGAVRYINPKTNVALYEHRDEPPIGEYHYGTKTVFKYRRCFGGRMFDNLEQFVEHGFGRRIHRRKPKT